MHADGCERRMGTVHSDHDLVVLLSGAGLAAPERVLDDPDVIEWRGARAHVYQAALTEGTTDAPARHLEVADTELDPDLLELTWQAIDRSDHTSVPRRILPRFATAPVSGRITRRPRRRCAHGADRRVRCAGRIPRPCG